MKNLLLGDIEYKVEKTRRGVWRRYVYPNGDGFAEYRSNVTLFGLPLVHHTRGKCPETGSRVVAKGIIAIGRLATGGLAIGHASAGVIAIGQASAGLLFGLGQATAGVVAIGQLALGFEFGLGQIATGETVVAQFGAGTYVLAQLGVGEFLWTPERADPEALAHFHELWETMKSWL